MNTKITLNCLVSHATMDPILITENLKLEPYLVQQYGDKVVTPKGNKTGGNYSQTKWSYITELANRDSMCDELRSLIDHLFVNRDFLRSLSEEGGKISIFFRLTNFEHIGFEMSTDVMDKMVGMKMDFGFEIFTHQNL